MYRYFFQYSDSRLGSGALALLRRLNGLQPVVHTHLTYGPRIGVRKTLSPFRGGYRCYGGKQWTILRRDCALYVLEESKRRADLMRWFRRTVCPDEAVVQTLLVNSGRFRLANDDLRYVDFEGSRDGRPRTLGVEDFERLTDGSSMFARKFDPATDEAILDRLDSWCKVSS